MTDLRLKHFYQNVALCEFHLRDENTIGHYFDRTYSLAKALSLKGYRTCLISGASHRIERTRQGGINLDEFIFEPGFSSFGQAEMACASSEDTAILKLFSEAVAKYTYKLKFEALRQRKQCNAQFYSLLNDENFLNQFISSTSAFYCAIPDATVLFCKLYLELTGFVCPGNVLCDIESNDTLLEELAELWIRIKREQGAYVNRALERVVHKYAHKFRIFVFLTASIDQLLAGLRYAGDESHDGPILAFILHQPNDFSPQRCYDLVMELKRLPVEKRKKIRILLSCEEFKAKLSSHNYSFLGQYAEVALGPFLLNSQSRDNYNIPQLGGETIARHYLGTGKLQDWIVDATAVKDEIGRQFFKCKIDIMKGISISKQIKRYRVAGNYVFAFLGDIRDEKNFDFYVDICIDAWDRKIGVIAFHPSFFSNGLIEKSKKAYSKLIAHSSYKTLSYSYKHHLTEDEYFDVLKNSDLIFNAYDSEEYKYKQSGIFYETLLYGRKSCILHGTAMAAFFGKELSKLVDKYKLTKNTIDFVVNSQNENLTLNFLNATSIIAVTAHDLFSENIGNILTLELLFQCGSTKDLIGRRYLTLQSGFKSCAMISIDNEYQNIQIEVVVHEGGCFAPHIEIGLNIDSVLNTKNARQVYEFSKLSHVCTLGSSSSSIFDFRSTEKIFNDHEDECKNNIINEFRKELSITTTDSLVNSIL